MGEATVCSVYTTTLLSGPISGILGVSWDAVLDQSRVFPGDENAGATLVSAVEFWRIWETMIHLSMTSNPAKVLGLRFASGPTMPLLLALTTAPNLRIGAHRMARFKNLFGPAHYRISEKDKFSIEIEPALTCTALPISFSSTKIIYIHKQSSALSRFPLTPTSVSLPLEEREREELTDIFGMMPAYGRPKISYSEKSSTAPFIYSNPELWRATELDLIKQATVQTEAVPFIERVKINMMEGISISDATAEFVARRMNISRTTLIRHLRSEGFTFQSLLDEIRKEHSVRYLLKSNFTNQQISHLLGYKEYKSFYRNFKKWTGMTPHDFRASSFPPKNNIRMLRNG